jgi:hypothetical protein
MHSTRFTYGLLLWCVAFLLYGCERIEQKEAADVVVPVNLAVDTVLHKAHQHHKPKKVYSLASSLEVLDSMAGIPIAALHDQSDWTELPEAIPFRNLRLTSGQFRSLKQACRLGRIRRSLAEVIVPMVDGFSKVRALALERDTIPVVFHGFKGEHPYEYYAVEFPQIGYQSCGIAFFHDSVMVGWQQVFYRYRFNIHGYKDQAGRMFVAFESCYAAGAGAGDFRTHYYRWTPEGLIPALELLSVGNWWGGHRHYHLESQLVRQDTLTVQFECEHFLNEWDFDSPNIELFNYTTWVKFDYDTVWQRYIGRWEQSRMGYQEMLTYTSCENDPLFVRLYAGILRRKLLYGKKEEQAIVSSFLQAIRRKDFPTGVYAKR